MKHNRFQVVVQTEESYPVTITATELDTGIVETESGIGNANAPVALILPDGRWRIQYTVADHPWETLEPVLVDANPPKVDGLESIGDAVDGAYTIGKSATVEEGATVRVIDMQTGAQLATSLPHTVTGLTGDGVYGFLVAFGDQAGNWANKTVQVRVGGAAALPEQGQYTFGILARYTNEVQVWDMSDFSVYLSPSQASSSLGGAYLGSGYHIAPEDPTVVGIVEDVLDGSEVSSAEVAFKLYQWLYDNLEYDDARLSETDLLKPDETVDRGGGVCRDLAALYVSMLRAAGVPARVVSGYLAGDVNGFHAWVEFYGGSVGDQEPWVPVDVSPIDGPYQAGRALSAFGILRPDYLTLRNIPESGETEGWSTALSVQYHYYGSEPDVSFEKSVQAGAFDTTGVLCVNADTLERALADSSEDCNPGRFNQFLPDFVRFTERIIDYGIELHKASPDTTITASISYPFVESVAPNAVSFVVYGDERVQGWQMDAANGNYVAEFTV